MSTIFTKSNKLNRPSWCQPAAGEVISPIAQMRVTPACAKASPTESIVSGSVASPTVCKYGRCWAIQGMTSCNASTATTVTHRLSGLG